MKTYAFIFLYLIFNYQMALAAKVTTESSLILKKTTANHPFETSITLRMPPSIKVKMWVTCFYYDKDNGLIGETNHVLNNLTPVWKVQSPPEKISFVSCTGE